MDVLEETRGKAIIWAGFVTEVHLIRVQLDKAYHPDNTVMYYGETPLDQRDQAIRDFQDTDSPVRFLVAQIESATFGLTLTAASTVGYYSNHWGLDLRLQSEDRAHRAGQTNHVIYVDFEAVDTIDTKIVETLRAKRKLSDEILNDPAVSWL